MARIFLSSADNLADARFTNFELSNAEFDRET